MKKNRIKYYLNVTRKRQYELADYLGVSKQAVSNWARCKRNPERQERIDMICSFFNPHLTNKIKEKHLFYFE